MTNAAMDEALIRELCSGRKLMEEMQHKREHFAKAESA